MHLTQAYLKGKAHQVSKITKVTFSLGGKAQKTDKKQPFSATLKLAKTAKSKVKVSVTIFGRATGVELDFAQVEKV